MFVIEIQSRKRGVVVKNCALRRPIIVGLPTLSVYIYGRIYCYDTNHSSFSVSLEMMTTDKGNIEIIMQRWIQTVFQSIHQYNDFLDGSFTTCSMIHQYLNPGHEGSAVVRDYSGSKRYEPRCTEDKAESTGAMGLFNV